MVHSSTSFYHDGVMNGSEDQSEAPKSGTWRLIIVIGESTDHAPRKFPGITKSRQFNSKQVTHDKVVSYKGIFYIYIYHISENVVLLS